MSGETATLGTIGAFTSGFFNMEFIGPRTVALQGELSMRDPVNEVGPFARTIHEAAVGGEELVLDLTGLKFVNSSGLRIFLDWIAWLSAEPPERRYRLKLRVDSRVMWQAAAIPPILILGGGLVSAEPA